MESSPEPASPDPIQESGSDSDSDSDFFDVIDTTTVNGVIKEYRSTSTQTAYCTTGTSPPAEASQPQKAKRRRLNGLFTYTVRAPLLIL